jgi:hypothetical protein
LQQLIAGLSAANPSSPEVNEEIAAIVTALGKLRFVGATDEIIRSSENFQFRYAFSARDALVNMQHPDVPEKVRPAVERNIAWASGSDEAASRILDLCRVLVDYQDLKSVDVLSRIIDDSQGGFVAWNIISWIDALTPDEQIIMSPFVLSFRTTLARALSAKEYSERLSAMNLLARFPKQNISELLSVGLRDENIRVQRSAATLAGKYGATSLMPKLKEMSAALVNSDDPVMLEQRSAIDEAITKLANAR